ncbi:zinc finger BED domain-containing protein RICESLEEPER 2-like [Ipomoea triloba]|uniref:zinc finger BED domain-containing protein RICESLEEPER 2-like n=1 Tax=Ipomoea triloba TaxID=35885 RepID=UPI00125D7BF9|nr:zinc finger BED domain-containing protein RICESLEEPER 2-like [Ipomoea triloba]
MVVSIIVSNDTAIGFLKKKMLSSGSTAVRCKYLHMRCIAHILNLVVQDGLKEFDDSVKKVRDSVRYMRNSPARLQQFRELADLIGVEAKNSLVLDVPTRWNSTYLMLHTALLYQKVFEVYEDHGPSFKSDLGGNVPNFLDWEAVEGLVKFLKSFYEMTVRISGSLYVTSNTFFSEVSDLSCILTGLVGAESDSVNAMGMNMRTKFDKYWGDPNKMNFLIFYGNIMDPRDKIEYMPYRFNQLYGDENSKSLFEKVMKDLKELYVDYVTSFPVQSNPVPVEQSVPPTVLSDLVSVGRPQSLLKSQLKKQRLESGELGRKKTELEVYLSEAIIEEDGEFDLLKWWKVNAGRFPVLSKMARDILVVPISTVASESTFSTSGRVLDAFRSSLTPKIVEALVCAQDWLRLHNQPLSVEENIDEVEKFEKEFCTGVGSSLPTILVN